MIRTKLARIPACRGPLVVGSEHVRPRLAGDAGAVTIEMAFVAPFLALIAFGMAEMGLAWRDAMSLSNAVRSGARVASSAGDTETADHQALVALHAALADLPDTDISFAIIYDAGSANGEVPSQCLTVGATTNAVGGIPDLCNVYGGDWIRDTLDPDDPSPFQGITGPANNPNCASSRVDRAFCPHDRESSQRAPGGPDYIGVYVQANHDWATGILGSGGMDLEDSAVMRIEPRWED